MDSQEALIGNPFYALKIVLALPQFSLYLRFEREKKICSPFCVLPKKVSNDRMPSRQRE